MKFARDRLARASAVDIHMRRVALDEVGQPVAKAKNLAREAERTHVEPRVGAAVLGRHHRLEESGFTQRRDTRAAGGIDVVMRQRRQRGVGPARKFRGEGAMAVVE